MYPGIGPAIAVDDGTVFIHSSPGASHSAEFSKVAKSNGNSADAAKPSQLLDAKATLDNLLVESAVGRTTNCFVQAG